jgi:uncharacterized membrane protein YqjE
MQVTGATTQTEDVVADARPPEPPAAGVFDELSGTLVSARDTLLNFLDLLSLESRRAGLALTWMIMLGLVAAICIVTAWLGTMGALVIGALYLGYPLITAVIAIVLLNGVAAALLIHACMRNSRALLFSATLRQLAGESSIKISP